MNIQHKIQNQITKTELIDKVSSKISLSKQQTKQVLNALISCIQQEVADGKKVSLVGFGSFSAINQTERTGMNPRTGEKIKVPPKTIPRFRAGKDFRNIVNGSES